MHSVHNALSFSKSTSREIHYTLKRLVRMLTPILLAVTEYHFCTSVLSHARHLPSLSLQKLPSVEHLLKIFSCRLQELANVID